jgi:hypothetical protein
MPRVDLTGNWREQDAYLPYLQTCEPDLPLGATRVFRQLLRLPQGCFGLELEYVPILDKEAGRTIGGAYAGFAGLAVDGQPHSIGFERADAAGSAWRGRCAFQVSAAEPMVWLSLAVQNTRPLRTWLVCDRDLPAHSVYHAIAPAGDLELLLAHGIPFAASSIRRFRFGEPSLEKTRRDNGSLLPWQDGQTVFSCGGAPVQAAHFLGMIHNCDIANGSWWSPKGDSGFSHFVGDRAGEIVVSWADGGESLVPLVFGFNLWYGRPWDLTWHFNMYVNGPGGRQFDGDLFGGEDTYREMIRDSVALVDGYRLMGSDSTNARFIFSLDLEGRAVQSLALKGVSEMYSYPLISAITLEIAEPVPALLTLPDLCGDAPNITPTALTAVPQVETMMRAFYTYVDEVPVLADPVRDEGYVGPGYDFRGTPEAVRAATYLYRNGPENASYIADRGMGCTSPVSSGRLHYYYNGIGIWFRPPTQYPSLSAWFHVYRQTAPGQLGGRGSAWTRGIGANLREALACGYDKFVDTYISWLDGALFAEANPPHWNRIAGEPDTCTHRVMVGDVEERGNRENDGHGICMWGRYMAYHWLGHSREWNERHWAATQASAEWLHWLLDTDAVRPGVRKDVLYTESECAHESYDIFSTFNCAHGLKLAIRMAEQLEKTEQVRRWTKLHNRLRQGMLDHLVDQTGHGPIWHTEQNCDWQDHAHSMVPLFAATEGDSYTPLQDYAAGDDLDRRFLEISRNTYRRLMESRNYNCLRMYGYGQGYMTQSALLLDEMEDAGQFMTMLLRHCYLPTFAGWACPEGIILHPSGKYYVPVNGYEGQDSHVAESTKAVRLMLGVDDCDPAHLRLVPRFPSAWNRMSIDQFPVLTGSRRQTCRYTYERSDDRQVFLLGLEQPAERISIRLGPIPAGKVAVRAQVHGSGYPFETLRSGDSDWVWLRDLRGGAGLRIEIELTPVAAAAVR